MSARDAARDTLPEVPWWDGEATLVSSGHPPASSRRPAWIGGVLAWVPVGAEPAARPARTPEFRVTRPAAYPPGCHGHASPDTREAYYVREETPALAVAALRRAWRAAGHARRAAEPLDVQAWIVPGAGRPLGRYS